jgi:hypothetical protein
MSHCRQAARPQARNCRKKGNFTLSDMAERIFSAEKHYI